MRFVGRVAIILIVAFGAAVAHSMVWPITRDLGDAMARERARGATGQPDPRPYRGGPSDITPPEPGGQDTVPSSSDPTPSDPTPSDPTPIEPGPIEPTQGDQPVQAELPEYYISVERAFQYWEEGMSFVDARTDHEREVGTIEGAFHLETRHFISGLSGPILDQMDRSFPVVVFCAGGECDASENVAQRLVGRGYTEVYIMHEGFGAWKAAGYPTESAGGG